MKKLILGVLIAGLALSFSMPAKAGYYDGYGDYNGYDNYGYSYPYSSYGNYYYPYSSYDYGSYSYPYSDYNNSYSYPYYNYSYPYNNQYSNGWYNNYFADNYNNYYNNGWDYNYDPNNYGWNNYWSNNGYDYGWDNDNGPMYIWNRNESNPTFELNNYQNYFDQNHLNNYYPTTQSSSLVIKKIEFIQKEETTKNIVVDNCSNKYDISQARIVVTKTTFIKIQETVLKTGDISLNINPDHKIDFNSPYGNFSEANAAIYFSK